MYYLFGNPGRTKKGDDGTEEIQDVWVGGEKEDIREGKGRGTTMYEHLASRYYSGWVFSYFSHVVILMTPL